MRILVTGATGYVGSRLVTALLAHDHDVVVAGRNTARLTDFGWFPDVRAVQLDAADPESVRGAFQQAGEVDVVYYLLHGIGEPGFREADNRAATNLAAAARDAGVRRIIYLGGFVPEDDTLSDHLAGRAEVAHSLHVDNGPEVVWLGAAMIIGAGSTSFEILRYVSDRFPVMPHPSWLSNPMDPISIRDVLHYLVAAADYERVPAGAYDICGPETTTYRDVLATYSRLAGKRRLGIPVWGVATGVASRVSAVVLPVPDGLAADLTESLDYPMTADGDGIRHVVPDPPGGLLGVDEAIRRSLAGGRRKPVNLLADPHHLADTDPQWAGGDRARLRQLAGAALPSVTRPALALLGLLPGPVAGAVRSGLDMVIGLVPKGAK
ncbi:NAD(P)H-binding protein [Mycolicibacterium goodii]|uniref:NAD(P)H-binding protein n=1 Tax=Mycolicibacterium goodii TaxID=134601 RepID=UPI001BDD72E2|nr:NAD(P)H-binding protein [Mycolicibacterium goodii]MBU8812425.1 NAD(P)H-binding protein [Mycolicibacterium goodii]MBU8818315.1 NAD(P)H-binding protein [Mycolicibacterium goodii]MBU8832467.1 NAD(P)H-binding protein [Mycolicibacterium goodii]ULN46323.1 NAD(P)H-binding protein [Mycolicibacterium goodii]